ncbi:hypothetical protein [Kiloniella laminariae]|uniref:hypothetical protein n=1 Tax=Kiloniella laminariae TaxID=454162 RepID=UPI0022B11838|nr:hypothetical protein [Kiloniella laminariae]
MDLASKEMVEEAYFETVTEALARNESLLTAHKEGVTAAAMLLAAMTGTEEDDARKEVVALDLRPQ